MRKRVTKGLQFRSVYADSNPLWEAKKSKGNGCWLCEIVSGEWAGTQDVFLAKNILRLAPPKPVVNQFLRNKRKTGSFLVQ
jgi:hypothetical protein